MRPFESCPLRQPPAKSIHHRDKQNEKDAVCGGVGAPSVSRPPTHVTAGTCHPQPQPILLDYTFCILCDIVDSQIRYSEGPRSLQDRLSPQNSRPRTLVPGRRGQRRPFTTARLSQGHARTENVQNSVSSTLPPRRPAPPVQSSSN